jgi:hypothetical protein
MMRATPAGQSSGTLLVAVCAALSACSPTHAHVQGWLAQEEHGAPLPAGTYRVQAWVAHRGVGLPVLTHRAEVSVLAATE